LEWLAKGSALEKEKIKRLTIGEYLELLKYRISETIKNG
jgi:hypothetical protein